MGEKGEEERESGKMNRRIEKREKERGRRQNIGKKRKQETGLKLESIRVPDARSFVVGHAGFASNVPSFQSPI